MHYLLAQATQPAPSQWASDLVYVATSVLGALGTFLGVWALLKGTRAETKSDANSQRITNTALHAQRVDDRLTDVAFKAGQASTGTGNGGGTGGGSGSPTGTGPPGFSPFTGTTSTTGTATWNIDKPKP